jgi:hypothetical protein
MGLISQDQLLLKRFKESRELEGGIYLRESLNRVSKELPGRRGIVASFMAQVVEEGDSSAPV